MTVERVWWRDFFGTGAQERQEVLGVIFWTGEQEGQEEWWVCV